MDVPEQGRSVTERTAHSSSSFFFSAHSSYLHYNMCACVHVSVAVAMAACEYAEFCPLTPYKTISENATYGNYIKYSILIEH